MSTAIPTTTATTVRAGDRERANTADQLGLALTQGYLDMPEYERRITAAFEARNAGDLRGLVGDLPIAQLRHNDPRRREARHAAARLSVRLHLASYLLMVVIVLTVWTAVALSGGTTYFWPVWPILGAGIGVLSHAIPIHLAVRRH
jgi:hypothetical protein